jgi:N utilization substance protein B
MARKSMSRTPIRGAPSSRRRTRIAAFQTLCEIDSVNHSLDQVLSQTKKSHDFSKSATEFLTTLTTGVLENIQRIDKIITEFAPTWPISQMAVTDRNLLRMAIYEMAMLGETPPKVAINEAVEVAKVFGSESSPRFVNGVLGSVLETTIANMSRTTIREK